MIKICIQAGHEGRSSGATGAPGEQEFTQRVSNRLAEKLRERNIYVKRTNADPHKDPKDLEVLNTDWNLFLTIHGDADVYGEGGGFLDIPEPSTDKAHPESKRIMEAMESMYFDHSGIVNKPNRRNKNTKYYYMWKYLSAKTPCVIIECGVMQNAHDKVILADTERVTNAMLRGIFKAFDIPWDKPGSPAPTPPGDNCKEYKDEIVELKMQLESKEKTILAKETELTKHRGALSDLQKELDKAKESADELVTDRVRSLLIKIAEFSNLEDTHPKFRDYDNAKLQMFVQIEVDRLAKNDASKLGFWGLLELLLGGKRG